LNRLFLIVFLLLAPVAWTAGCGSVGEGASAEGGEVNAQPSFALRGVTVGFVGMGILVQNHMPDELRDVEIVINEDGPEGGYRFHTALIGSNTTSTYLAKAFRNAAGQSFNPLDVKAKSFALFATTERGRGFWRGEY
jgi:hypothetical protein